MNNLPPEYAAIRRKMRRVVKHLHAQYSQEIEAAYARGLADAEQQIVYGLKTVAKLNGSGAAVLEFAGGRVVKAAAHAPAGGVDVQGKHYPGGQFIPAEVMEKATAEEKEAVHNPKGSKSKANATKAAVMTKEEYDKTMPPGMTANQRDAQIAAGQLTYTQEKASQGDTKSWADDWYMEGVHPSDATLKNLAVTVPDKPIKLYRAEHGQGGTGIQAWTTDKAYAEQFMDSGRKLIERMVDPKDIVADMSKIRENDSEVVVASGEYAKRMQALRSQAAKPGSNVGTSTSENPTKVAKTPAQNTIDRTRKLLASDQPLSKVIAAVQQQLEGHTHAELAEIKAQLGIRAGGAKAEMARKIAERAARVDKTNRRHYVHAAMSVDEVHDLIKSHAANGTLDTADGVRSVVQAIGTGLTVRQVAELKQRLGIKAGGAKHEMATKIALRAAQGKKAKPAEEPAPPTEPTPQAATRATPTPDTPPTNAPTKPDRSWTKNEDGTYTAFNGQVWKIAAAGGEVSPVTGEMYQGGRFMPIHGGAVGMAKPPKGKGVSTGDGAKVKEDDGEKRQARKDPLTPEEIESKRARAEDQRKFMEASTGPIGKMTWLGERLNNKSGGHDFPKYRDWLRTQPLGTAQNLIGQLEPYVHGLIEADATARGIPLNDERVTYEKNSIKDFANENLGILTGAKKLEKEHPGAVYAETLLRHALYEQNQPKSTALIDRIHGANEVLKKALAKPTEPPQQPETSALTPPAPQPTPKAPAKPKVDHAAVSAGLNTFIDSLPGGKRTKAELDAALAPLATLDKGGLIEVAKATGNDGGLSKRSSADAIRKQIETNMGRLLKTSQNVNH